MEINQHIEKIGNIVDRLDNIIHTLQLPMPPHMHIESLQEILPEIKSELKDAYINITGENPWDLNLED